MQLESLPHAGDIREFKPHTLSGVWGEIVAIDSTANRQVLATTYSNYLTGARSKLRHWQIVGRHPVMDRVPPVSGNLPAAPGHAAWVSRLGGGNERF